VILASIPIFSTLEHVMKSILDFFHSSVGLPWSWSIVALTIVVRICIVPLTVKQIHSMQAMQVYAPQMKELQKKYKGDRQKQSEELQKFYKEHHINPAASCLPLLAQFPVFIALYLTLKHYSKRTAAGHITGSWLHVVPNITAKATSHWSGYVLLAIYAGSQSASTYFMGTTMPKSQRNIMMFLPLFFITIIARFPVGLVIYWVTTNLWTVGQGLVTRRLIPATPAPKLGGGAAATAERRSSRTPPKDDPASGNGDTAPPPPPRASSQPRRVRRKKGGSRR
jgi:YidC/Oxa1 family membrane protein insertase